MKKYRFNKKFYRHKSMLLALLQIIPVSALIRLTNFNSLKDILGTLLFCLIALSTLFDALFIEEE